MRESVSQLLNRIVSGHGRSAIVARTALVSIATRGFSIVASLLTVPLVLHHLGHERYGIWLAAIALSTFFTLADGGVTKGLISEVAKANGAGDRVRIQVLVASAFAATMVLVVACLLVTLAMIWLIDWRWAFNLSSPGLGFEAAVTISIICGATALSFPATVIRETRLGLLQGAAVNAWDLGGTIAGFMGLVAAVWCGWGLVAVAALWVAGPLLARTAGAIWFLSGKDQDLIPVWGHVNWAMSRMLFATGSVFLVYILTQTLAVQSDQILIARFLGVDAVTDYSVVQRLFNQPQILVTLVLAAQWPAYSEALGRGDHRWVRHHFNWSLAGFTLFAVAASAFLGVGCNAILKAWVGDSIAAPQSLIVAMAVYGVVATIANVYAFFFMALGLHRHMIATQLGMFAINLPLTIWLLPRIGSVGAIVGTTVGYVLAIVVPGFIMTARRFGERASGANAGVQAAVLGRTPV